MLLKTSNRTLEDIDILFRDNKRIEFYGDSKATMKRRPQESIDEEERQHQRATRWKRISSASAVEKVKRHQAEDHDFA